MDRGDDDQVVFLCDILDERYDLEGCGRVQTGGWLVQEEQLWTCDELSGDTDTTLLTTGDTLTDRCTDQVVGLVLKTKGSGKGFDTLDALKLADR